MAQEISLLPIRGSKRNRLVPAPIAPVEDPSRPRERPLLVVGDRSDHDGIILDRDREAKAVALGQIVGEELGLLLPAAVPMDEYVRRARQRGPIVVAARTH